jgi:hypothetical protein
MNGASGLRDSELTRKISAPWVLQHKGTTPYRKNKKKGSEKKRLSHSPFDHLRQNRGQN